MKKKIGGVSSSMKARGAPRESLENATIVEIRNTRDTDSVFRYEPFGIFPVFSYRIPKGNSVGKFGIRKLAGALYTHGDHTPARRLLSARIWGGRLLLARGNHGAFSERDIILPLFCDHHLIVKHKALLPTFEDEDDDNS